MKIIWTDFALKSLREIYFYYTNNVSKIIADKIKADIFNSIKQLKKHPNSGTTEFFLFHLGEGHKYLICRNYKILYKIINKNIYITDIFDTRQSPDYLIDKNQDHEQVNDSFPIYTT